MKKITIIIILTLIIAYLQLFFVIGKQTAMIQSYCGGGILSVDRCIGFFRK